MPTPPVVIDIAPTRLEIVQRSRRGAHLTESLDSVAPDDLGAMLDAAQQSLRQWVGSAGARHARATVLYKCADAAVAAVACPRQAGSKGAHNAVRLALADAVPFSLSSNPWAWHRLWTDRRKHDQRSPHIHAVGVADSDENLERIADWVSAAGLRLDRAIPSEVPLLAQALREAVSLAKGQPALVLRFAEHACALAAASDGVVFFLRILPIGSEELAKAYRGPAWSALANARTPRDEHDLARTLLFNWGIPDRDATIDEQAGITALDVLPRLQPVLQRIGVELKQSVRFGLSDDLRASLRLAVTGFGAAIPRLDTALAAQAGLQPFQTDRTAPRCIDARHLGPIAGVSTLGRSLSLLPTRLAAHRTAQRVQRATWIGAASAAALILGSHLVLARIIDQRRRALDDLIESVETDRAADLARRVREAADGVVLAERLMTRSLGKTPDLAALLTHIALATPATISLDELHVSNDPAEAATCTLRGRARTSPDTPAAPLIKAYVDALSAAPIVRSVSIGGSDRQDSETENTVSFILTLELVRIPALALIDYDPQENPDG